MKKKFFAIAAVLALLSCAASGGVPEARNLTAPRLEYAARAFARGLEASGAKSGAMCVVIDGKTVFQKVFSCPEDEKFQLGNTSQALLSLMLASMESAGAVRADWKVSRHCSFLSEKYSGAFADFLSMRAGVDPHADDLLPRASSAAETFEAASQIQPISGAGGVQIRSRLSAALAGYALGYVFDKREKNMKKSFAACSEKYLFKPLKFSDPRFASYSGALFPATAYALSIGDTAKWLECETSPNPPIATRETLAQRRFPKSPEEKFANGWMRSSERGAVFFVAADSFENRANVCAVFPSANAAAAFFAHSPDAAKSAKLCADSMSKIVEMLTTPAQ